MAHTPFFRSTPAAIVCLIGFVLLAAATAGGFPFLRSANEAILDGVISLRSSALTAFYTAVTQLGGTILVTAITSAATVVLLWRKRYNDALFIALIVVLTAAFTQLFKYALSEPRPPVATMLVGAGGPSFPSGHSACSLALYASLATVLCSTVRTKGLWILVVSMAVALIVLIGISRVYLGVHWASDVLGGWFLAGALFASAHDAWKRGRFEALLARFSAATSR